MTTRTESKPWDFSHVLDLVNSLSTTRLPEDDGHDKDTTLELGEPHDGKLSGDTAIREFGTPPSKLGDFGKIWQFLGSPLDLPAPEVPLLTSGPNYLPAKLDYTSDGATYFRPFAKSKKEVTWQDEASADEPLPETTDDSASPETPTLTKTQRKKQRRKERKALEGAKALKDATVSESEADANNRRTPARKASTHFVKVGPPSRKPSQPATPVQGEKKGAVSEDEIKAATARVAESLAKIKQGTAANPTKHRGQLQTTPSKSASPITRRISQPVATPATKQPASVSKANPTKALPITPATRPRLVPSSVQPQSQPAVIPTSTQLSTSPPSNPHAARKFRYSIEPKIVRSGEDRHYAFFMKLINDFWEDRRYLFNPMNLTTHNNDPTGIHVFVDASNIFIGFNDQLKRSRGIPPYVQLPPKDLSFDALALLMERRRPVAKRVLAGSTPYLPAFDKAKAVGYECSILEKVYKARELTERQIFFQERDRQFKPWMNKSGVKASAASTNNSLATNGSTSTQAGSSGNGASSESETTPAPQYAPARLIEQGVDEILHLKMLESIVDTDSPSTMVLATGDAAQAEYSPGFMAMVERALKKGWKVELVSWSRNISGMYQNEGWQRRWGERFRVILLDDYAEEMFEG